METIFVQVKSKEDADLIKRFLSKVQSVLNIGTSKNKRLNKFIEELEMEEDVKDYDRIKQSKQKYYTLQEATEELKRAGKL